ncbi:translation initiation factor IF-2-like isoform X1 [Antechinus flavipes]|uniref:translation initiation factor IF-2-like isoform X1 n=1 Tax=Antechinus flavipes TaxID=38775 RepID=UPI002235E63D|nr:translation initiation factor IF-2-like isoform X1 [Antechinus flavipes]
MRAGGAWSAGWRSAGGAPARPPRRGTAHKAAHGPAAAFPGAPREKPRARRGSQAEPSSRGAQGRAASERGSERALRGATLPLSDGPRKSSRPGRSPRPGPAPSPPQPPSARQSPPPPRAARRAWPLALSPGAYGSRGGGGGGGSSSSSSSSARLPSPPPRRGASPHALRTAPPPDWRQKLHARRPEEGEGEGRKREGRDGRRSRGGRGAHAPGARGRLGWGLESAAAGSLCPREAPPLRRPHSPSAQRGWPADPAGEIREFQQLTSEIPYSSISYSVKMRIESPL